MDARNTPDTAFVNLNDCSAGGNGISPTLVTEASDLGWKPGYLPRLVVVEHRERLARIGNLQPFGLLSADEQVAIYRQMLGTYELHVLND